MHSKAPNACFFDPGAGGDSRRHQAEPTYGQLGWASASNDTHLEMPYTTPTPACCKPDRGVCMGTSAIRTGVPVQMRRLSPSRNPFFGLCNCRIRFISTTAGMVDSIRR